jgi:hypothetical protein
MSIRSAIWRVSPQPLVESSLANEKLLADMLMLDPRIPGWFAKRGYSAKASESDLIHVSGGNNLDNIETSDDLRKVRLIEVDFHRLMVEVERV